MMVNFEMLDDVLFDSLKADGCKASGYVGINERENGSWKVKVSGKAKTFKSLVDAVTYLKDFVLNNLQVRAPKELSQDYLKEILDYDEDTGIFTWKVDKGSNKVVGQGAGSISSEGYVVIHVNGKMYQAHRLVWFYEYGEWPTNRIDHIDQDKTNNRPHNLREVTQSQNLQNRGKPRNNTSGHKGVSFKKQTQKCVARIQIHGKSIFLGLFSTPELASAAYIAAQEKYHTHRPQL